MKWDIKSIITVGLVYSMIIIALLVVGVSVWRDTDINETILILFSNSVTMVLTYFFTKKKDKQEEWGNGE